jgi:membrane protein required for colicin V production
MGALSSLDFVIGAVLGIAALRGLFRGLTREVISLASLAAACVAVRLFATPLAAWLVEASDGGIGELPAPWIAGIALAVATLAAGAVLARVVRGSARAVGLGWADHAGGAVLGVAEGALVSAILLLVLTSVLGRDHTFVAGSRSLAALEELERVADAGDARGLDVAAPPRR